MINRRDTLIGLAGLAGALASARAQGSNEVVIGAIYPTVRAVKLTPIEALRHE